MKPVVKKIKKQQPQKQYRYVVNLLFQPKPITNDDIEILLQMFPVNMLLKRLYGYFMNYPPILSFFNKRLNSLYDMSKYFGDKAKTVENVRLLFETLRLLVKFWRLTPKYLTYIKASDCKDENRQQLFKLFKQYFEQKLDEEFNHWDVSFYYKLFQIGYISPDMINAVATEMSDKQSETVRLKQVSLDCFNYTPSGYYFTIFPEGVPEIKVENEIKPLSVGEKLEMLEKKLFELKEKRAECQTCELRNNPAVFFEVNAETFDVDVVFVGLNPGREEAKQGRPFIGPSGKRLREKIGEILALKPDFKYLITNIVMCSTPTFDQIQNPADVIARCKPILFDEILSQFKYKYIIPIGSETAKVFNVDGKITEITGQVFNNNIIPIIHPSSLRNQRMYDLWNSSWNNIMRILGLRSVQSEIVEDEIKENWTLFDIRKLGNDKLLFTFIDENGDKHYITKDERYHIFINKSPDYRDWTSIHQFTPDDELIITPQQRKYLMKLLQQQRR